MMHIFSKKLSKKLGNTLGNTFRKTSISLIAATLTTVPFLSTLEAIAAPSAPQLIAQLPQDWQTGVKLLRLLDNSGNLSSIGILFDLANKPATSYANVVYQLYVKRSGEWREVYTNSGARLLSKTAGRYFVPVEVIPLNLLSEKISLDDVYNGDLKAVTSVRYDIPNGAKDARFVLEEVKSFSSIVAVSASEVSAGRISSISSNSTTVNTSTNTVNNTYNNNPRSNSNNGDFSDRDLGISSSSQPVYQNNNTNTTQTTVVKTTTQEVKPLKPIIVTRKDYDDEDDEYEDSRRSEDRDRKDRKDREGVELSKKNPHRGHFSLAVLQSQPRLSQVIARVSIKSKRSKGFIDERFVGDYRFNINQRATFIRGLNPGDRLIVRLFDLRNRPLGYSEVQLLKDFSTVNIILPSDPSAYGTLRTVSGIDSQRIGQIDRNVRIYDYYTRIQTTNVVSQTVAQFLTTSQGIPVNSFNVAGLPQAPSQCTYTNAFAKGEQSLINRTIDVFNRDMPPVMQVLPGQLSPILPINDSNSTIDVVRKIIDFKDLKPNNISTFF